MHSRETEGEVKVNDLQRRVGRIDDLVARIDEAANEELREDVRELVDVLLELHGTALEAVLDAVYAQGGQSAVDDIAESELVGSLLMLHGLHPLRRDARVRRALESVRPYLQSHGGNVELVEVTDDGTLFVRLEGSCDGCPSSSATLKYAIEEAVYKEAPDIVEIEVVDSPSGAHSGFGKSTGSTNGIGKGTGRGNGTAGNRHTDADFIPISAFTSDTEWDDCPFPANGET